MSTRDEDILDFDFFDEEEPPAWDEPPDRGAGPPRDRGPRDRGPRGRGPRFRAPSNLTPLLRLVALIALAILVVVLLAVWVEGCATDRQSERYGNYVAEIGAVGNASARLGRNLANQLTTVGLNQEDLDQRLGGFIQTAENQMRRAEALDPPGPLVRANEGAIEALRYRANGLRGLRTVFQETTSDTEPSAAGEALSVPVQRLLASDVIWEDSFRAPASSVLQEHGVEGLQVLPSTFVATGELAASSALAAIWQRIQTASTGGTPTGLHGTGISYVKALPSGQVLSATTETTIRVTDQLSFEVGIEDTGDSQEVRIRVTLTIPKQPEPIVQRATIPIIDPGEVKAVTFRVGGVVPFGEQVSVKVDVDPVPGESNTTNNTAEYPVIFTL
ncbi:MAG TPA: hypothetical protein VMN35_01210 [Gaiellaceae bacterium]|nr:hypothetical protein [Gaiellaceae bacterium]